MSIEFASPPEICVILAERLRDARLAANLTQEGLAERAGVAFGTLKRFERTGAASFDVVVRLAIALRLEDGFRDLFVPAASFKTIDDVVAEPVRRRRGRNR